MARRPRVSTEGIEAASRTYIRCANILREELEAEPTDLGLGPRAAFEETVTLLRATLERRLKGATDHRHDLTQNDFSFNEVLRLMRLTAIKNAGLKKFRLTREEFIRRVNTVLQEEGGLKVARRLVSERNHWAVCLDRGTRANFPP